MLDYIVNIFESGMILFFLMQILELPFSRRTAGISVLFCILSSLFITWVNQFTVFEGYFFSIFDILIHYCYLGLITSLSRPVRFFLACLPLLIIAFINTVSAVAVSLILYGTVSYTVLVSEHYVFMIILTKLLFILSAKVITRFFRRSCFPYDGSDSRILCILTVLVYCHLLFYEYIVFGDPPGSLALLSSLLCLSLITIMIMYFIQTGNNRLHRQKFENELLQAQLDSIRIQAEQQTILCSLAHDLRHYINCIPENDTSPEAESLRRRYELSYLPELPYQSGLHTILNIKKEEARSLGIDMSCRINLPDPIEMEQADLCLLTANLLDNAIRHIGRDRILRAELDQISSYTRIRITNSIDPGAMAALQSAAKNSPKDGHGYGLRTIRTIADRYHAHYSVKEENGELISSVLIPMKKKAG